MFAGFGAVAGSVLLAAILALSGESVPDGSVADAGDPPPPASSPAPASVPLADGEWFGFVSVVRDGERVFVSFDDAEMLSGEDARQAAADAGMIKPGDDVPNDFFIANPDPIAIELRVHSGAEFFVLSGMDPGVELVTDIDGIESLYSGSYAGPPVYGIIPGSPIAMQVDVSGGELVAAHAVYLP